jgi:hypothetical protein
VVPARPTAAKGASTVDRHRQALDPTVRKAAPCRRAAVGVLLLPALVIVGVLLLAGCGGGSSSDGSGANATTAGAGQDEFVACMRSHGVDIQPGAGGAGAPPGQGGGDDQANQEAIQACQQYRPSGGGAGPGMGDSAGFASFISCMRDEGVELPDQQSGGAPGAGGQIDPSDPTTAAALQKCQSLIQGGPPGGGGSQ